MNIVVCCKFVPNSQDMEVLPDRSVSFARAEWQISDYDLQAIEAGVQLAKATDGKLTAISLGTSKIDNAQLRKDLLSRGPDELFLICDDSLEHADTGEVSALLAEAVKKIGADIVLCDEGSADHYYQQTGLQLGERLGWACLNSVDSIEVEGDEITVERVLETEKVTIRFAAPAVLSVTTGINTPPRPNMRAILQAGKKPFTVWPAGDLSTEQVSTLEIVSTLAPDSAERGGEIIEGTLSEAAAEIAHRLKADGLI